MPPEHHYTAAEAHVADKSVGDLVTKISEQASTLVREEIELAKAEMSLKARSLGVGAGIGVAAGFFVFLALIYAFQSLAFGLADIVDSLWLGFLIVTILLLVFAAIAGFIASRMLRRGAPPTPDLAIQEARLTKEALEHHEPVAPAPVPTLAPTPPAAAPTPAPRPAAPPPAAPPPAAPPPAAPPPAAPPPAAPPPASPPPAGAPPGSVPPPNPSDSPGTNP